MQQKVEEAQREKEELVKNMAAVQQAKEQLEAEKEELQKEFEEEKETCAQLRKENQVSRGWWNFETAKKLILKKCVFYSRRLVPFCDLYPLKWILSDVG